MARSDFRETPLVDEEKEKAKIEWENNVLFILMPSVGLIAFLFGLIGVILVAGSDSPNKGGISAFLIILLILGGGGIAYGVIQFIKRRNAKLKKPAKEVETKQEQWSNLRNIEDYFFMARNKKITK